jgi:methylated-DNA-[protein]-cysteine S-methyltransferase
MMTLAFTQFASPVGELTLVASDRGLVAILWPDDDPSRVKLEERQRDPEQTILVATAHQLTDYFTGDRRIFDLPLDMRGTDFQQQVWRALLTIPFGETRSYGQLASAIGRPTASRAVGAANGRNPLSIVAPCHRVIGGNGALTGFAGGMETKQWLLEHERGATRLL